MRRGVVALAASVLVACGLSAANRDGGSPSSGRDGGDVAGDSGSSDAARSDSGTVDAAAPTTDGAMQPMRPSLESLRNTNPLFRRHQDDTSSALVALGFDHPDFTEPAPRLDNGASPQGQFRLGCQWSHFAYDDPIVRPGAPGANHLHMFWGNTEADAFTVFNRPSNPDDPSDIIENGGSTCQAFELNRSAYWIPALLDNSTAPRNVVIPDVIILYYKSHRPSEVHPLPPGVQLVAGNVGAGAVPGNSFDMSERLSWQCGVSGSVRTLGSRIPTDCRAGEYITAVIQFPQCLAVDGGGAPILTSPDFLSHTAQVPQNEACPASHPYRVPQISYLIYWPNGSDGNGAGVENWVLSSDRGVPGGSLHGDWLGGWNDEAIETWVDGCFDPEGTGRGSRNCSLGQTGTSRQFVRVSRLNDYDGPNFLPLPE